MTIKVISEELIRPKKRSKLYTLSVVIDVFRYIL